jgi:broad specificity phosphatase PhoE
MARTIWIVRHASRLDFDDPTWFASAPRPHDPPLSPAGVVQARELGRRLQREPIAHLFASPFLRTVETAAFIAAALGLRIKVEPGFSEWLNRDWFPAVPELLPLDELARRFPGVEPAYVARGAAYFGESGDDALRRSAETARCVARDFAGDVLIVGHGASVLGATAGLLGVSPGEPTHRLLPHIPCACLVKLVCRARSWVMELAGDTAHLSRTDSGDRFH